MRCGIFAKEWRRCDPRPQAFQENAAEYKAKADAVSQAEIYRNAYAISVCNSEGLVSPTVVGAQAANELLDIRDVKASFVLTEYQNKLFFSLSRRVPLMR